MTRDGAQSKETDLALVNSRAGVTEEEQPVHEPYLQINGSPMRRDVSDAQARHGPPEVAPAAGQNAGLHGLSRRQEPQCVPEHGVWQSADPVRPAFLAALLLRKAASPPWQSIPRFMKGRNKW